MSGSVLLSSFRTAVEDTWPTTVSLLLSRRGIATLVRQAGIPALLCADGRVDFLCPPVWFWRENSINIEKFDLKINKLLKFSTWM